MSDNVVQPMHYANRMPEGVEVIDVIRMQLADGFSDYCMGNVIKYVLRWQDKNGVEDLRKAQVYLDWAIDNLEGGRIEDFRTHRTTGTTAGRP